MGSIGDLRASAMGSSAVTWPTDTWGSTKVAFDDAITMSASATKCRPPPAQMPLTAAITGLSTLLCHAVSLSSERLVWRDCSRSASLSLASWRTSRPVWKAFPSPVLMITRTWGSAASSFHARLELHEHGGVHRVARRGPVEPQPTDVALALDDQALVRRHDRGTSHHGASAYASGSRGRPRTRSPITFLFTSVVPPSIVFARLRSIPFTS